jgi:hypothetical protein
MKLSISKVLDIANGVTNPQQGAELALGFLDKRNPEAANTIRTMIQAGKNPQEALKDFAAKGQIRKQDLGLIKKVYGMMKRAGFKKYEVPDSFWEEVESSFNTSTWF